MYILIAGGLATLLVVLMVAGIVKLARFLRAELGSQKVSS